MQRCGPPGIEFETNAVECNNSFIFLNAFIKGVMNCLFYFVLFSEVHL